MFCSHLLIDQSQLRTAVSRDLRFRRRLVVALLAYGHFAPRQADLGKDGRVETKRLVHVRHDLDDFADEIAILVLDDFGDETRADRLAI